MIIRKLRERRRGLEVLVGSGNTGYEVSMDDIAIGQPLLDIKPSLLEEEYSGNFSIPTRTTSTLTPTTLKNIEESFMEYQNEVPPIPVEHNMQAGFAPPSVIVSGYNRLPEDQTTTIQPVEQVKQEIIEEDAGWVTTPYHMMVSQASEQQCQFNVMPPMSSALTVDNQKNLPRRKSPPSRSQKSPPSRRAIKEEGLSPEEESRRKVRRERNKQAAARCRQRRTDHTNTLQDEVNHLVDIQKSLEDEVKRLTNEKRQLEMHLGNHDCARNVIVRKGSVATSMSLDINVPTTMAEPPRQPEKRPRPTTLPVSIFEATGVPVQTPSAGMYSFEGLIEGTGMTPSGNTPIAFSPSCATQQQRSSTDAQSPDSQRKLVTL